MTLEKQLAIYAYQVSKHLHHYGHSDRAAELAREGTQLFASSSLGTARAELMKQISEASPWNQNQASSEREIRKLLRLRRRLAKLESQMEKAK